MSTIQSLFQQAQLAEAAYADFSVPGVSTKDALVAEKFSPAQAATFLTQWEVVDQYISDGISITGDNTGFSATLFRNKTTGQYIFAMRGSTDPVADFMWADASLATGGIAIDQLVSMVNYVLRLDAGASGQTAQLLVDTPPGWPFFGTRTVVWSNTMVQGVGPNIPLSSLTNLTLTGHSLGGSLAQMYQRIFGGAGVDTFNAVGIGNPTSPVFDQLTTMLGLPSGSFSSGAGDNLLVPGEVASTLPATVMGQPQIQVFSETENTNIVDAHLMSYVTDSLAVYNLFATLDPSLNDGSQASLDKITNFLKSGSSVAANSLENALDALRTLFQSDYPTGSPNKILLGQADPNNLAATASSATTLTDNRESLYHNLQSLQTALANSAFNLGTAQAPEYGFTLLTLSEAAKTDRNQAANDARLDEDRRAA